MGPGVDRIAAKDRKAVPKETNFWCVFWEAVSKESAVWCGGKPVNVGEARSGNGYLGFNAKDANGVDRRELLVSMVIGTKFTFSVDSMVYTGAVMTVPAMTEA